MAMFDDPKKELQLLQEQLLQDEEWFARELESAKRMIGDVPAKKPQADPRVRSAVNTPKPANPPRSPKTEPVPAKKKKGIRGLVVLALLETCGIVGIAAYWLLVLLK